MSWFVPVYLCCCVAVGAGGGVFVVVGWRRGGLPSGGGGGIAAILTPHNPPPIHPSLHQPHHIAPSHVRRRCSSTNHLIDTLIRTTYHHHDGNGRRLVGLAGCGLRLKLGCLPTSRDDSSKQRGVAANPEPGLAGPDWTGLTSPAHRARQNVESVNGWLIRSAHSVRNSADSTTQQTTDAWRAGKKRGGEGTGAIFLYAFLTILCEYFVIGINWHFVEGKTAFCYGGRERRRGTGSDQLFTFNRRCDVGVCWWWDYATTPRSCPSFFSFLFFSFFFFFFFFSSFFFFFFSPLFFLSFFLFFFLRCPPIDNNNGNKVIQTEMAMAEMGWKLLCFSSARLPSLPMPWH